jgi:hypothetical protein
VVLFAIEHEGGVDDVPHRLALQLETQAHAAIGGRGCPPTPEP